MTTMNKESVYLIRIAQSHYVHVLNLSTNITRTVLGPRTHLCQKDEKIVVGPEEMICINPMMYCVILNPVVKSESNEPVLDSNGQVKLRRGDKEYRFYQDPFPLYPGEKLEGEIELLPIVARNSALRLQCLMDFKDTDGSNRIAGDEWYFEGPGTYYPRKEVKMLKTEEAETIEPGTALCLMATIDCTDRSGNKRSCGEKWLVDTPSVYLPGPHERLIERRLAYMLTDKTAIHVRATRAHVDKFGIKRRYGDIWLITSETESDHVLGVHESLDEMVDITVLGAHKYCIILNPVGPDGIPQLGKKLLVKGEKSFFLQPGEILESGVQDSYILQHNEGLLLRAENEFNDDLYVPDDQSDDTSGGKSTILRRAGDQWTIRGPMEYVPPVHVTVVSRRSLIPLDSNEGIYVRNTKTGTVRAVIGEAYMLRDSEELWKKKLPDDVLQLLSDGRDPLADRGAYAAKRSNVEDTIDLTRVVTFQVPHNAAVQIYDYKNKKARVEFGPTLIMLGPDEQFTKLSLSGGKPKQPNRIKSLCLLLGPDFCTDVVVVETADHARLSLQLSYNWHFDVPKPCSQSDGAKLFSVPDFVGDACKAIASRIRGSVASVKFDDFHRNSARIIRCSVFGLDSNDKVRDTFVFPQNSLYITSVDVQSVEPVDQRTRDALQKSVQLAIEITTKSQEAAARHEAERIEQEARGRLERQKIEDEASSEESRRALLELRVELAALESSGQAKAEAVSRAEAARIDGESGVQNAEFRAKATLIETDSEIDRLKKARTNELEYMNEKNKLKIQVLTEQMKIEVSRFTAMVNSIGAETIKSIANAGSDHNLRMLSALGLQSTLITDGTTPVNLLSTAHGLIGQMMAPDDGRKYAAPKRSKPLLPENPRDRSDYSEGDEEDRSTVMS